MSLVASIRFGHGVGPHRPQVSAETLLEGLYRPDTARRRYQVASTQEAVRIHADFRMNSQAEARGEEGAKERRMQGRFDFRAFLVESNKQTLARMVEGQSPLRERLVLFWADHFAIKAGSALSRVGVASFVDTSIRPNVTARFSDMLLAVMTNPVMLDSLDQVVSVAPDSMAGLVTGRGLNENLARELLELHTIGVGAGYTQSDIEMTARLLAGLSFNRDGFMFRERAASKGPLRILGHDYGRVGQSIEFSDIERFFDDLARHPATAVHMARKLAVHFVSGAPDEVLVADLARVWQESGADLGAVTQALVRHPLANKPEFEKVKTPIDFVVSAFTALGVRGEDIAALPARTIFLDIGKPLEDMGQPFLSPPGPDGWSEENKDWISPPLLAARLGWITRLPEGITQAAGDPRKFLEHVLGDYAGPGLRFAVSAAETKFEAVALVLASAEFNRR